MPRSNCAMARLVMVGHHLSRSMDVEKQKELES
jgi:hypothetical protein